MNTFVFVGLLMLAEVFVLWIAYSFGQAAGWIEGWEARRPKSE
jgi:hypothetical protein